MKTTFIYALCEPGTRTIRYIGKTSRLKRRLKEHWSESRNQNTHLGHWLSSLKGLPILLPLKEIPETDWKEWERRYIRNARVLGFNLVNGTDGGEGTHNPSPETRAKMVAAKIGKKPWNFGKTLSQEYCEKLSIAHLGQKPVNFGKTLTPEQSLARVGTKYKNNTSGFVGISWHRKRHKFQAQVSVFGTRHHVGLFSKIEDAVFVRALALANLAECAIVSS